MQSVIGVAFAVVFAAGCGSAALPTPECATDAECDGAFDGGPAVCFHEVCVPANLEPCGHVGEHCCLWMERPVWYCYNAGACRTADHVCLGG